MKLQTKFVVLASLVVGTFASNTADVLKGMSAKTTELDNAITAFSASSTLLDAWAIHSDTVSLGSLIDEGTSAVNTAPKPISDTDLNTILADLQALQPTILHALSQVTAKKADFIRLPINAVFPVTPGLIKRDLVNIDASVALFEEALIASAPADLVFKAQSIKAPIDVAVASTITAYS